MKGKLREIKAERKETTERTTRYHSMEKFQKAIDNIERLVRDGLRVYVKIRFTSGKTRRGRIVKGRLDPKTFSESESLSQPDIADIVTEFKWGEITEEVPTIDKNFYHGQIYLLPARGIYLRDE